jgi:hypothetical protein
MILIQKVENMNKELNILFNNAYLIFWYIGYCL